MTTNDVDTENIDKEFRNNSQSNDLLDHNPTQYSLQYLLNQMKKLEFPRLEIDPQQIVIEHEWTSFLQMLINYANKYVLKSFQFHLEIEITSSQPTETPEMNRIS